MNSSVLSLMVIVFAQVAAFQFASIRLGRALPDAMVGQASLPDEVSLRLRQFRQGAGRVRRILGAVLCIGAAVTALALPLDPHARKVTLAVISLVSSGALVLAYVHDYREVLALSRLLPEPAIRVASLRPRSLRAFYSPLWEAVPATIYIATIAVTLWFARGGLTGDLRVWLQPIIGAVLLAGLFALSLHRAARCAGVTPQSKPFHSSPEAALDYDLRLRRMEMRYSLFSRIGIAVLLAVIQIRTLGTLRGSEAGGWSGAVLLAVTLVLLASFARYSHQLGRIRRESRE